MWLANNLVAPIVTGVFVGLALRAVAIAGEVSRHDLRAGEIETDLTRWVNDRGRVLDAEVFHALNLARQGIIEDVAQAPPPPGVSGSPGDQSNTGAFNSRVERIMRQVLHEYRDEASGKVSEYRSMARSEGWLHRRLRRWRQDDPPSALKLSRGNRAALGSWRERTIPTQGEPTITVGDDPTMAEDARNIHPLEEGGLTWEMARRRDFSSNT